MKLSFNLKNISVLGTLKKKLGLLLWIFLLLVALLTGTIIFKEWRKIVLVNSDTSGVTGQIVKVNIKQYQTLENQLNENARFVPQSVDGADAFGSAPIKTPGQ